MGRRDHPRARDLAHARLAQHAAAFAFDQPVEEIAAATRRSKSAALARQIAMYLTHVAFGVPISRVAVAFDRDRTTVTHACQLVEDRRDDPSFDAALEALEAFLRAAPDRADCPSLTPQRSASAA